MVHLRNRPSPPRTAPNPREKTIAEAGNQNFPALPLGERFGFWLLQAFIIVTWLSTVGQALPHFLPDSIARLVNLACLAVSPLLILGTIVLLRAYRDWRSRASFDHIAVFVVLLAVLACYGLARGNAGRVVAFDVLAYLPVVGGLLLGRFDRIWKYIVTPVCLLTAVSLFFALRLTDARVLSDRSVLNLQVGSFFESGLTLAPLLAMVAATERRYRSYVPLLFLSICVFFVYLYFGRRGISIRAALEIIVAALIVPLLVGLRNRFFLNLALLVFFVLALLAYFPFDTLVERYLGRYGIVDTITADNARWFEASILWNELSWPEIIFGRGLGGVFMVDRIEAFSLDTIEGNSFGKMGTHLGAAFPILKGGIVLLIVYFIPCFRLLSGLPGWRGLDRITLACAAAASIWFAFQFIEGSIGYATPWVGFGIGLMLSRSERVGRQSLTPNRAPVPHSFLA